ncbi:MAG: hypothetical protein Q9217_002553 [Psora testacea]
MPIITHFWHVLVNALDKFHNGKPDYKSANTVFDNFDLAACIMENIRISGDLLNFVHINRTTRDVFKRYHRTAFVRCLRQYRPRLGELALSLVLLDLWLIEFRTDPRILDWLFSERLSFSPSEWPQVSQPIQTLQSLTRIANKVDGTVKALRWPRSKYLPYQYAYRTRPGTLLVHAWTAEGRDAQHRIEKNMQRALWHLHLYNELWYKDVPADFDEWSRDLSPQLGFLLRMDDRDVIELSRLFDTLYRRAERLKEPAYALLLEKLKIGEQALVFQFRLLNSGLPFIDLKRHLVYQFSVGLPLLLQIYNQPKRAAMKASSSDCEPIFTKQNLVDEAIEMHMLRAKQRRILWGREMYRLKAVSGGDLNHVRYTFHAGR